MLNIVCVQQFEVHFVKYVRGESWMETIENYGHSVAFKSTTVLK